MYRAHPGLSKNNRREGWDWSLRDVDLAKKYKLSRERVRQIRKALGK
jgi:DNA-directed RNA polymerase sigma subunit (sigma70/sigma32)